MPLEMLVGVARILNYSNFLIVVDPLNEPYLCPVLHT
jgi:hypothetical protein